MRAPEFWWRRPPTFSAKLLAPFGWLYGQIAAIRLQGSGARAAVPVICIGNPVAGGAGKTPCAMRVARLLMQAGRRPVFLTRGYGGTLEGPVLVDPAAQGPRETGDEPRLLARVAPCIVSRDRAAGAAFAATFGDIIVMDDGFQNPALLKDLALLVIDAGEGVGNGMCIPAGPLRAPLAAQFARAQALVVVGEGEEGARIAWGQGVPVVRARLVPDADATAHLRGRKVLAFAGIGRPQKFLRTLREIGAETVRFVAFPDHHVLSEAEEERVIGEAIREDLLLVTTEKDKARLEGTRLAALAETVPVDLRFEDDEALLALLRPLLR